MDWATVITSITALGIVEGSFKIIDKIRFKKEEKQEKKESVEQTAVATDRQQIDLGDLFLEKTQKWAEILESNSIKMLDKIDENNKKRDEDWKTLKEDMKLVKSKIAELDDKVGKVEDKVGNVEDKVGNVEEFLDGDFDIFKKEKNSKKIHKHEKVTA